MSEPTAADLLTELTRQHRAIGHILTLCAMPKKTEAALRELWLRQSTVIRQATPPAQVPEQG